MTLEKKRSVFQYAIETLVIRWQRGGRGCQRLAFPPPTKSTGPALMAWSAPTYVVHPVQHGRRPTELYTSRYNFNKHKYL